MDIDPAPINVALRLDRTSTVIAGTVEDSTGTQVAFYGWLELSSTLDTILSRRD